MATRFGKNTELIQIDDKNLKGDYVYNPFSKQWYNRKTLEHLPENYTTDDGYVISGDFATVANQKNKQGVKREPARDSKGYWTEGRVKRGGLEDPIFQEAIRKIHNSPIIITHNNQIPPREFPKANKVTQVTVQQRQTPIPVQQRQTATISTPPSRALEESVETRINPRVIETSSYGPLADGYIFPSKNNQKRSRAVTQAKKETPSVKKVTIESLPESWGNITLDQARAELQDYYNQVGEQIDVSKMSDADFINEFNKYLEYQNSKLNDQYYQTKPLVIQQQEQPRQEQSKYANVDLSRKEVRDILNLYGYNPYSDFTASQRRAIRKRAAGNKDLDMEWLRNFDHTLNGESLYDFFVTYRKRGGKLISNNIVERFKNRYKL